MRKISNEIKINQKYGFAIPLFYIGVNNYRVRMYLCLCTNCNEFFKASSTTLRRKDRARSCGCYQKDVASRVNLSNKNALKHGHRSVKNTSHEYHCYHAMLTRCYNSNHIHFDRYGGRGIEVCQEWRESFEQFLIDMGTAPTKDHSLDRYPDNNAGYFPGNVRWSTAQQQANNRG